MEKMQKETCDAVLIFPPIRLSVLLIYSTSGKNPEVV
jgi:hypothetical protein